MDRDLVSWWAVGLASLAQIVALARGYRRERHALHALLLVALFWVYDAECRIALDALVLVGKMRPWATAALLIQLYAMTQPWARRERLLACASAAAVARLIDQPGPSHGPTRKWMRFAAHLGRRHVSEMRRQTSVRPQRDASRLLCALRSSAQSRARVALTALALAYVIVAHADGALGTERTR